MAETLDEIPPLSTRTYAYQAPQYFLTLADGPWGTLDWTYDTIGNRLSESRGTAQPPTATSTRPTEAAETPRSSTASTSASAAARDYTWGAAGHLEEVDAAGNVIDFESDDAGRLASVGRAIASETAAFLYL